MISEDVAHAWRYAPFISHFIQVNILNFFSIAMSVAEYTNTKIHKARIRGKFTISVIKKNIYHNAIRV